MSWFIKCLKQYADFSGRARRKEYWYFVLFASIISLVTYGLDWIFNTQIAYPYFNSGWFNIIASVLLILPSFAVIVRRLHDVNKSAWFLVILYTLLGVYFFSAMRLIANDELANIIIFLVATIIYLVFGIWFIVLMCLDGVYGENKWGSNPKGVGNHVCAPEVISNVETTDTKPVEVDRPKEVETKPEDVVITEPDEKEEESNNIV